MGTIKKAIYNALSIGLNLVTNCKAGMKQGID